MRVEGFCVKRPALRVKGRDKAGLALVNETRDPAKAQKAKQPINRRDLDRADTVEQRQVAALMACAAEVWTLSRFARRSMTPRISASVWLAERKKRKRG